MRTSLNKIKSIEEYLLGHKTPGDALLFEATMLIDDSLADDMQHQLNAYKIIRQYSRQKLKAEIAAVQDQMILAPQHQNFWQSIVSLFNN